MADLFHLAALRLALLTDIRRAARCHRSTRKLRARLTRVTAQIAALEAAR